jgi:hypothetical protein
MNQTLLYEFNKGAVALASCDHQKCKMRAVAGAKGFWVAELRVRQLKIGSKSCFEIYPTFLVTFFSLTVLDLHNEIPLSTSSSRQS